MTLDAIDIAPRGSTIVDLLGRETHDTWSEFGCCYGSRIADWTPARGEQAARETKEAQRVVNRATREQLAAWLTARGVTSWPEQKRHELRTRAMIEIGVARYPRRFVNEAQRVWSCSACKATGDLLATAANGARSCSACGAAGWKLWLQAKSREAAGRP